MRVCDQLEDLVDKEYVPIDDLTVSALQEEIHKKENELQAKNIEIQEIQRNSITEIQRKDAEIQRKDTEIHNRDIEMEALRCDMSKMQVTAHHLSPKQVDY